MSPTTIIPCARRLVGAALVATAAPLFLAGCASPRPTSPPPAAAPGVTIAPAPRSDVTDAWASTIPAPDADPGASPEWTFHSLAFLWVPSVKGKAGRGADVSKSDVSVSDMADVLKSNLERALLAHVEARTDRWGLFGEIIALELEDDASTTTVLGPRKLPNGIIVAPKRRLTVETEGTLKMSLAELGATFDLTGDLVSDERTDARIEALVGARYYDVEIDIDINRKRLSNANDDWLDGFVGARASVLIDHDWDVLLRGDVGGFGIGTSSDFAWRATAIVRYRPLERVGIFAGWHILDIDWNRGSGANEAIFDLRMSGPVLGFTYDF